VCVRLHLPTELRGPLFEFGDAVVDFFGSKFGEHGQRNALRCVVLGIGYVGLQVGKFAPGIALLLVDGDGIVLLGVDAVIHEELSEMVALVMFDDIEMINMTIAGQFRG
jgi:hypothetical protein